MAEDIKEYAVKKGIDLVEVAIVIALGVGAFIAVFGGTVLEIVNTFLL